LKLITCGGSVEGVAADVSKKKLVQRNEYIPTREARNQLEKT
jgi:hypothetical protein